MKILILGSDKIHAIENLYLKYLKESGFVCTLFPIQRYFYDFYYRNILNKIVYRIGISGIVRSLNRKLIDFVEHENPDLIWVFKGMEILPSTLKYFKSKKILLVNYNPDNPFIFTGKGSGNKNITNSVSLYDFHFTYNLEIKKELEYKFKSKVFWLPFGFDLDEALFNKVVTVPEIKKVCFIGNPDKERIKFLSALLDNGVKLDIYGDAWDRHIQNMNATIFPLTFGDDFWFILRKYRIQLNLLRIHNLQSHNMRTFEVPAVGGIMLTQDSIENKVFYNKDEVAVFTNINECLQQISELMELSEVDSLKIRVAARQRSISSGYSYRCRAEEVARIFKTIKSN